MTQEQKEEMNKRLDEKYGKAHTQADCQPDKVLMGILLGDFKSFLQSEIDLAISAELKEVREEIEKSIEDCEDCESERVSGEGTCYGYTETANQSKKEIINLISNRIK